MKKRKLWCCTKYENRHLQEFLAHTDVIGVIELWSIQPLLDNNATSSIIENGTDLEITTFEESTLQVSCLSLVGEQEYRKDILIDLTAKLISGRM